ncbi:MAG TPA: YsnF/AvaK domain-containing protein [Streptosporangiaceae bacterium]|nr:YsnF/AvaK domain-containing protein [Streptosporangiaceae bacterium]
MTMHADQLVGAPVTDSDGLGVGTIEQVFRDDVDGTPSWARIRSSKGLHFVPIAGSSMTSGGGLSVPYDTQKILAEPDLDVDRHMSVEQEEQLRGYFGLNVPAQAPPGDDQVTQERTDAEAKAQAQAASPGQPETTQPDRADRIEGVGQPAGDVAHAEWLTRSEERLAVKLETSETARVKLRKYIDTERVEQAVRVFHEEYEIERSPVTPADDVTGEMAESEQEIVLHEARAIITKEAVPVERVRLSVRKVEEDQTITGELRRERIEIDSEAGRPDMPANT